ncbi:MAG: TadE/TadG family type IV pilus assembly protein [Methylocystis sp.]
MRKTLHIFRTAQGGLAMIEFAFALPFLLLALLGFVELDRYISMTRRLEITANSIAEQLAQDTLVSPVDVTFAQDSTPVLFPAVLADSANKGIAWAQDIAVSMSSIVFTPTVPNCVNACDYIAQVAWSSGPNAVSRPCDVQLQAVPDTQNSQPTTLPADAFGPVPLITVDVAFNYSPLFGANLLPAVTIHRSAYMQPRYLTGNSYLQYSVAGGDNLVTTCPGF